MIFTKRGEGHPTSASGGGAATLVALIAGLILIYILFLTPEETAKLLEDDGDDDITKAKKKEGEVLQTLLDESPGRIDVLRGDEFEIDIPSFNLFKATQAKEIERFNDFSVRNGVFDKQETDKSFFIRDLENTDNVILSFITKKHKGTLLIDLNGERIFEGLLTTENVEPIRLRKQFLQEGENTLHFSVSKVGLVFWRTNEYIFQNIKIVGDLTDVSRQKTRNIFTIEPWKYNNLEKASIRFNPECNQADVGVLDVIINSRNIFSGIPDCGLPNRYTVPVGHLDAGLNDIVFITQKGSYLVDRIEVKLELEELSTPLYYFEVEEDLFENISRNIVDVNLTLEFVDDRETKILDLNVNGHLRRIDQDDPFYTRQINTWVEEGTNYVRLVPKDSLDIVNIRVETIEK